jgi:patatin-like phospholipase/acyl hydrolase
MTLRCYDEGEPAGQFNVLSLDGGGLKGVYSAAVLAMIEEDYGVRVIDHVDLIAGTSTGGILALGLAREIAPRDLLALYCDHATRIFPGPRRGPGLFRRRYPSEPLRALLTEALDDAILGDSRTRLLIPAYDIDSDDVYLFRTPHSAHLRRDWRVPMVDVALATSAAPGYFAPHRVGDVRMIDGGIFANNPSMLALTEAVRFCGQPWDTVQMLSVGTTTERRKVDARRDGGGLVQLRHSLVGHAMRGQSRIAENHPRLLIGDDQFHRIDPVVPAGLATLDRLDPRELISRARSDSRHLAARLDDFFAHRPPAFQPLYPALEATP